MAETQVVAFEAMRSNEELLSVASASSTPAQPLEGAAAWSGAASRRVVPRPNGSPNKDVSGMTLYDDDFFLEEAGFRYAP
jgi:hypothetical protein